MTRVQFFVFALVAMLLWGYHLTLVSPMIADRAAGQAFSGLAGAPAEVAFAVESQRSTLEAAVVRLTSSPSLWNVGPKAGGKADPPSAERFAAIRAAAGEVLAESAATSALLVTTEGGSLFAVGADAPGPVPAGLDPAALSQAGSTGVVAAVNGVATLFFAVPLLVSDKNEVRTAGAAVVGLPLIPDPFRLAETIAKDLQLEAVGIAAKGKLLAKAGPQKALVDKAFTLKANQSVAIEKGPMERVWLFEMPMFAGDVTLETAIRRDITGTPYEVLAVGTSRGVVAGLISYQKFALAGLLGLVMLALSIGMALRVGDEDVGGMSVPMPLPPPPPMPRESSRSTITQALQDSPHAPAEASPDDFDFPATPSAIRPAPPGPTSTPPVPPPAAARAAPPPPSANRTGTFGAMSPSATLDQEPSELEGDPWAAIAPSQQAAPSKGNTSGFGSAPPPPRGQQTTELPAHVATTGNRKSTASVVSAPPGPRPSMPSAARPAPAPPPPADGSEDNGRTMAYPVFAPGSKGAASAPPAPMPSAPSADPFAFAGGSFSDENEKADATRVAMVSPDLISAARAPTGSTGQASAYRPPSAPMPKVQSVAPVGGGAGDEEKHFQEVFRDFVATRERCGEPADGLTFDKFKVKLLKNKEQLVAKYNCKTVRFQVYVKDGKAALKATPVKD